MRIGHRYLTYDSHKKTIKPLRAVLDKFNISYKYKESLDSVIPTFKYIIDFNIYEDNPDFREAKREVDKFGMEPQIGTIYEKSDIEKAEWFVVSTGEYQYPQPEDNFGYLTKSFNLDDYCPLCGIGKVQNAPFRLRTEPKQLNNQFWGLHWEFDAVFVRDEAKNILERQQVRNIRFSKPVLHKKNASIEGFYQMHIDTMLPQGFDNYNTNVITCMIDNEEGLNSEPKSECCGRIKFHHPMIGGYLFDKNIFSSEFDIVETYEYFGSGGSAHRLQIFSKKIKGLVEQNKLKGISFIPIMHDRLPRIDPVAG